MPKETVLEVIKTGSGHEPLGRDIILGA